MKKLIITLIICLMALILATGCSSGTEDLSAKIKVEVSHDITTEGNKMMDICYPIVGGLDSTRTISTINSSITNYIDIQVKEFNNALGGSNTTTPINDDFDATVTKQITPEEEEEEESVLNDDENSENQEDYTEDYSSEDEGETDDNDDGVSDTSQDETSTEGDGLPITLTMDFEITYHHNNILNIVETYEKVLGDNKDYKGQQSFVFDLEKGTSITLGDIYDFEGDFTSYIDDKITKEIENNKNLITFDDNAGFSGIRKDTNFYIDEEERTLYIFYNALEISPEKNILPTFAFSLKELSPYLLEDYQEKLK